MLEAERLFPGIRFSHWENGVQRGEWGGIPIFISGIGKANAAMAAAVLCMKYCPTSVLVAGICGTYRESGLGIGEVVTVTEDIFVDESLCEADSLTMVSEIGFPVCENNRTSYYAATGLRPVAGNTVSMLSGTDRLAALYFNKTKAAVETMEGAAFALAFSRFSVPAYQVRAVSNYCGERSRQQWDVAAAMLHLGSAVQSLYS